MDSTANENVVIKDSRPELIGHTELWNKVVGSRPTADMEKEAIRLGCNQFWAAMATTEQLGYEIAVRRNLIERVEV